MVFKCRIIRSDAVCVVQILLLLWDPVSQVRHHGPCPLCQDGWSRDPEEVPLQLEGPDIGEAAQLRGDCLYPVILNVKNCQLFQLSQPAYFQSGDLGEDLVISNSRCLSDSR